MKLLLTRAYWPNGTNGVISHQGVEVVKTIELPWRDNRRSFSCIPEGLYGLKKRYSERWGWHVMVKAVKDRSFILFHSANDALKELRGCIALVISHTGEGKGIHSVLATKRFRDLVFEALERGEEVKLQIVSQPEEALNLSITQPLWTSECI
ncbi:hypothetical protein KI659_06160 [Litoribacter alkaliphilus]|uniref:DUF5675 domain-containing protein n=1 Tax=Litoribacter ruber TaxID=702568 RepID=A0AAP2G4M5_9BACT|nr:DUF5675 family protein [Litoribacter alkaliphilus]MBS9523598.1 hypothetical protein [Litoribacter alkaliphilus]